MIKTLINTYWQSAFSDGTSFLSHEKEKKATKAEFIIQLFYFITVLTSIQTFSTFYQFPEWNVLIDSADLFIPVWSVKWISFEHWEITVRAILIGFLLVSLIGLFFWQQSRVVRVAVFVSMFMYVSLISSFGKIDHYMHHMMLVCFLLIFIPNKSGKEGYAINILKVTLGIQTMMLLTYFTSGIFKLYGILDQEIRGVTSALSPDSLALNLSKTSLAADSDYFLSSFILNNSSPLFSVILIMGYLIEFCSIYIIFKPKYHRIWAVFLIALHAGILLSVGPDFTQQVILIGLFLLFSPFHEGALNLSNDVKSAIQSVKNRLNGKQSTKQSIIFYDGNCLMCNGFLKYISKYELPAELKISTLQSARYKSLLEKRPDLAELDSIVIAEVRDNDELFIRTKAKGITWILSRISRRFTPLKYAHQLAPFIGNIIYDQVSARRTVVEPDSCPIPPENIRRVLID